MNALINCKLNLEIMTHENANYFISLNHDQTMQIINTLDNIDKNKKI